MVRQAAVDDLEVDGLSRGSVTTGRAIESRERQIEVDVPTLIALSTVAWALALSLFFGLWLAVVNLVQRPRSTAPVESIRLTRTKTWLAVGLVVFLIFVAVLGPGLGPLEDDPRLT
jgi:hypothetical protein